MIRLAVIRLAQGASRAQFLQKQAQIFTSAVVNAKKKADNKKKVGISHLDLY